MPLAPDRSAELRAKYPRSFRSTFWEVGPAKKIAAGKGFTCAAKPAATTDYAKIYEDSTHAGKSEADVVQATAMVPITTATTSCSDSAGNTVEFEADDAGGVFSVNIKGPRSLDLPDLVVDGSLTPPLPAAAFAQSVISYFAKYATRDAAVAANEPVSVSYVDDYIAIMGWALLPTVHQFVGLSHVPGSYAARKPARAAVRDQTLLGMSEQAFIAKMGSQPDGANPTPRDKNGRVFALLHWGPTFGVGNSAAIVAFRDGMVDAWFYKHKLAVLKEYTGGFDNDEPLDLSRIKTVEDLAPYVIGAPKNHGACFEYLNGFKVTRFDWTFSDAFVSICALTEYREVAYDPSVSHKVERTVKAPYSKQIKVLWIEVSEPGMYP